MIAYFTEVFDGSALSDADANNLRSQWNEEPAPESLSTNLLESNKKIGLVIQRLTFCHAANPTFDIPYLDIIAAMNFHNVENLEIAEYFITSTINSINIAILNRINGVTNFTDPTPPPLEN